jgi:hypothetical protein
MAERRETGTAMIKATKVTHKVPMMKEKSPKAPLEGAQVEENNREKNGLSARMGLALRNKPMSITRTMRPGMNVRTNIVFRAKISLKSLIYLPQRDPILFNPSANFS